MKRKRIRILLAPLYLKLYDEAEPEARGRLLPLVQRVADGIRRYADVEAMEPVTTPEEAAAMERRAGGMDAVALLHLAYSPSMLVAEALRRVAKPLLVIDTTQDEGFSAMSGTYCMDNHGIHAVMDLTSVLRSMGVEYRLCAGYHGDEEFLNRLGAEIGIIASASRYRKQRIAMTGEPFAMMGDFAIDTAYLKKRFGHEIIDLPEEEIEEEMNAVEDEAVDERFQTLLNNCEFAGDESALRTSVRQSVAMARLFERSDFDAYTMNYNCFERIPVPFLAINDLMAQGYGYAGEGDILTASLGVSAGALSDRVVFSEFFCPDWPSGAVIMSHMGETNPALAKEGGTIRIREKRPLGRRLISHYYEFATPGREETFVTWRKEYGGGLSLLTGLLESVDAEGFAQFGAPHLVVKPIEPLAQFLERYSREGGGHHLYLLEGDQRERVASFAKLIGVRADII